MLNIFKIKIDIFFLQNILFNEIMPDHPPLLRVNGNIFNMNDDGWWKKCLKCSQMCTTYGNHLYPICERCNSN